MIDRFKEYLQSKGNKNRASSSLIFLTSTAFTCTLYIDYNCVWQQPPHINIL